MGNSLSHTESIHSLHLSQPRHSIISNGFNRELREKLEAEISRTGSQSALKVKTQLEAVIQLTLEKQEVDRAEQEIQSIQTRLQQAQSTVNTNREVGLITDIEAAE